MKRGATFRDVEMRVNIAVNQQYARKKSPQRQKTKRPAQFEMGVFAPYSI